MNLGTLLGGLGIAGGEFQRGKREEEERLVEQEQRSAQAQASAINAKIALHNLTERQGYMDVKKRRAAEIGPILTVLHAQMNASVESDPETGGAPHQEASQELINNHKKYEDIVAKYNVELDIYDAQRKPDEELENQVAEYAYSQYVHSKAYQMFGREGAEGAVGTGQRLSQEQRNRAVNQYIKSSVHDPLSPAYQDRADFYIQNFPQTKFVEQVVRDRFQILQARERSDTAKRAAREANSRVAIQQANAILERQTSLHGHLNEDERSYLQAFKYSAGLAMQTENTISAIEGEIHNLTQNNFATFAQRLGAYQNQATTTISADDPETREAVQLIFAEVNAAIADADAIGQNDIAARKGALRKSLDNLRVRQKSFADDARNYGIQFRKVIKDKENLDLDATIKKQYGNISEALRKLEEGSDRKFEHGYDKVNPRWRENSLRLYHPDLWLQLNPANPGGPKDPPQPALLGPSTQPVPLRVALEGMQNNAPTLSQVGRFNFASYNPSNDSAGVQPDLTYDPNRDNAAYQPAALTGGEEDDYANDPLLRAFDTLQPLDPLDVNAPIVKDPNDSWLQEKAQNLLVKLNTISDVKGISRRQISENLRQQSDDLERTFLAIDGVSVRDSEKQPINTLSLLSSLQQDWKGETGTWPEFVSMLDQATTHILSGNPVSRDAIDTPGNVIDAKRNIRQVDADLHKAKHKLSQMETLQKAWKKRKKVTDDMAKLFLGDAYPKLRTEGRVASIIEMMRFRDEKEEARKLTHKYLGGGKQKPYQGKLGDLRDLVRPPKQARENFLEMSQGQLIEHHPSARLPKPSRAEQEIQMVRDKIDKISTSGDLRGDRETVRSYEAMLAEGDPKTEERQLEKDIRIRKFKYEDPDKTQTGTEKETRAYKLLQATLGKKKADQWIENNYGTLTEELWNNGFRPQGTSIHASFHTGLRPPLRSGGSGGTQLPPFETRNYVRRGGRRVQETGSQETVGKPESAGSPRQY